MTAIAKQVCIEALSLPKKARADLAHRLLVSLEDEPATPGIEEAWKEAAERRLQNLRKRRTTGRDAKQAVREARKRLAK
jgi:hypothetical protein